MATVLPRHALCVLGNWKSLAEVEAVAAGQTGTRFTLDGEYSQLAPDDRMTRAFESSMDRVTPSLTDEDRAAIRRHSAVAYLLSPPILRDEAETISGDALRLIASLLGAGGLAAKAESSGLAHGRGRWLDLARDYEQSDDHARRASLYRAWVRRPLLDSNESVLYTCGMHLLGHPDVEIADSVGVNEALEWLDLLGLYLVADKPQRPLKDGEGFRLGKDRRRRVMAMKPCQRYPSDDFFYNPYGHIRLADDGKMRL